MNVTMKCIQSDRSVKANENANLHNVLEYCYVILCCIGAFISFHFSCIISVIWLKEFSQVSLDKKQGVLIGTSKILSSDVAII